MGKTNSPSRYVAFLRAVNVGGRTIKMEPLRRLFEELGLAGVETFIASGNVIFESAAKSLPRLEKRIEDHLKASLGYEVATFLRSTEELASIAAYQPFPLAELAKPDHSLQIAFLPASPSQEAAQKLMAYRTEMDEFHLHQRELYWLSRQKISQSKFNGAHLEKALGMPATMRNSTTVKKLAARYAVS